MRITSKLRTITKERSRNRIKNSPVHPGEILKAEFIDPMGITQFSSQNSGDTSSWWPIATRFKNAE